MQTENQSHSNTQNKCCETATPSIGRRRLLQSIAVASAMPMLGRVGFCESLTKFQAESYVGEFYASLTEAQRKEICRPYSDPLRTKINANWHITSPLIGNSFYQDAQRAILNKIVQSLTSEDGYKRLLDQMEDDDGGLNAYSVAVFGTPGEKEFQWVLTGRHLTLRADGESSPKIAFGGGMVYGHGEESSAANNLFYYQTKKVNQLFKALDPKQAEAALLTEAPDETDVRIRKENELKSGIGVKDMSSDQQALVRDCLSTILGPYREEDGQEAMELIQDAGGIEKLRFAFYRQEDLGNDGEWDIWRIEGPSTVIHFRGAPHVHAYIHIAQTV